MQQFGDVFVPCFCFSPRDMTCEIDPRTQVAPIKHLTSFLEMERGCYCKRCLGKVLIWKVSSIQFCPMDMGCSHTLNSNLTTTLLNLQCLHQLMEASMVAQAMSRDADDGGDEIKELDGRDDRPDCARLPPSSTCLACAWTARSSSPCKQDSCRGLLTCPPQQEQGPAPHVFSATIPSTVFRRVPSLLARTRFPRKVLAAGEG